jgi:intraflagellar transport protein 56
MLRPGSAIKRKQKPAPQMQQKQQEQLKLQDAGHFLKLRDFIAALALLECDRKYSHRHDNKTYLGIAYCAFHNGDYKRAMDIYDELMKRQDYDTNIHTFKACGLYALC